MGFFDFFKKKQTGFEEGVGFYEGEDFYQLTKQYVTIYKDGKEIGSGFLCYSIFENYWDEDIEDHERQEEERLFVLDGKEIVEDEDFDYDETEWGEERELSHSNDLTEITKQYQEIQKDFNKS